MPRQAGSGTRAAVGSYQVLTALLYLGFFLTGTAVASFGAILPSLLGSSGPNDATGGLLLFGFFVGSSAGSLFAKGLLGRVFLAGCGLVAASTASLVLWHRAPLLLLVVAYGLGLGMCMTCVSLQRSRTKTAGRVAEFARLNLVWAVGALAGPVLGHSMLGRGFAAPLLLTLSGAFTLLACCTWLVPGHEWMPSQTLAQTFPRRLVRQVAPLLVLIPLATGIESAAGGWLTTYAERYGLHVWNGLALPLVFWGGLMLCRLVFALGWLPLSETGTMLFLSCFILFGTVLLAVLASPVVVMLGALLLGWGVGCTYPVALAALLRLTELGNLGFLIAGLGGASIPLATGLVSQRAHSLRGGMLFLLLPASMLFLAAVVLRREATRLVAAL